MDYACLYELYDAGRRGALHASPQELIRDPFAVLRGDARFPTPLVCEQFLGHKPYDLIGMGYACLYLLSDRLLYTLRKEGVTGWTAHPVEVRRTDGEVIPGYHVFVVTGRCGPIDDTRSEEVWRPPPTPTGQSYKAWLGLYFAPETWDGSDVFVPQHTGHIIVVERVRQILQEVRATNIEFDRLTEVERTFLKPPAS